MKCKVEGKNLVVTIPLQDPTESKSGKTLVVASTHGNQATGITVQDQPLILGLNAYIRKPE